MRETLPDRMLFHENAVKIKTEIVERANKRKQNKQNIIPRKIKKENCCTDELKQENKDANKLSHLQ